MAPISSKIFLSPKMGDQGEGGGRGFGLRSLLRVEKHNFCDAAVHEQIALMSSS